MLFKVGEIRPYVIGTVVSRGKIIKVDVEDEEYTIEDIETKKQYIVDESDVFIGDD